MPIGYLKVNFPDSRQVYVKGAPNGLTNEINEADIGNQVPVTLAGDDYTPDIRLVDIYPDQTSETSFTKNSPSGGEA